MAVKKKGMMKAQTEYASLPKVTETKVQQFMQRVLESKDK